MDDMAIRARAPPPGVGPPALEWPRHPSSKDTCDSGDAGGEASVRPQATRTHGVPQAAGPEPKHLLLI
jgi:hypothetical protein